MYYLVIFPQHPDNEILNVYWRGLCVVEDLLPGKFCRPPWPLTMTQATLIFPLLQLIALFVPTILYVLVLSIYNAKKGMRVTDHAILFIFPIFTNLYYNFESEVQVDTRAKKDCRAGAGCQAPAGCQARAGCQAECPPRAGCEEGRARSHSSPDFSTSAYKGFQKKRFQTFICMKGNIHVL